MVAEITDLSHSLSDYSKFSEISATAQKGADKNASRSKNYFYYRTLKNIGGIAKGAMALTSMVFSLPAFSSVFFTLWSIGVTLLSIKTDLIRLDFDKN